jgi:SSS family solute:Na+ symporter
MSLLVPALGVGSSILRVQTKTVLDFNILPASSLNRLLITAVNAILALAVALKGGEIINLIVCFYASYVAAVFVPFVAYLLDQRERYTFAGASVKLSLIMGSMSSIFMLILTFINPNLAVFGSVELNIMLVGITFGVLGLLVGQVIEKYLPTSKVSKEI